MKKVAIQISRWVLALVLATLGYFFTLILGFAVSANLLPDSDSIRRGFVQFLSSAAFLFIASALAPSARKGLVSLYLSLLAVLAYAVTAWLSPKSGVPTLLGTVIGAACVVSFFRFSAKPLARTLAKPDQEQPERQPLDEKPLAPGELRLSGLSDGVILALASAGAYAVAFAYEAGFGSLYRIPPTLISLNLTTGFVAAAAGASALILSYQALSLLVGFFPRSLFPSGDFETRRFARFLTLMFLPSAYFTMTGLNPIIIFGCIALMCLIYARRPAAFAIPPRTTTGVLFEKVNPKYLLTLDLIAYLLLGAFILGRHRALSEPQFICDQDAKHYIMLRIYGDNIIAAPYAEELSDHSSLIVGGGLRFFKVGDKDTPDFQNRSSQTRLSIPRARLVGQDPWLDWAYPYE